MVSSNNILVYLFYYASFWEITTALFRIYYLLFAWLNNILHYGHLIYLLRILIWWLHIFPIICTKFLSFGFYFIYAISLKFAMSLSMIADCQPSNCSFPCVVRISWRIGRCSCVELHEIFSYVGTCENIDIWRKIVRIVNFVWIERESWTNC